MKALILILVSLSAAVGLAGPSYHEALEALVILTEANNEADGDRTYLVCLDMKASGPTAEDAWLYEKTAYLATVYLKIKDGEAGEGQTMTFRFVYNLVFGPYWSFDSLVKLYGEPVENDAMTCGPEQTQFSCKIDSPSYQLNCGNL